MSDYELIELYIRKIRPTRTANISDITVFRNGSGKGNDFVYTSEKVFITEQGKGNLDFLGLFVSIIALTKPNDYKKFS